jgi:[ribosomal protein S5]-alanine N-acetyltransferase
MELPRLSRRNGPVQRQAGHEVKVAAVSLFLPHAEYRYHLWYHMPVQPCAVAQQNLISSVNNKEFMTSLPKPILGDITALTITTPDLEKSLACYQKLGFKELMRADWPFPWIQVTDGVLLIMLRKDPKPYLALTYYVKNIDKVVKGLDKKGITFTQTPKKTDMLKRYLFQSPDGLNISLVGMVDGFSQPPGPGMLQMKQEDYFKPEKYVNKTSGLFGELAHPVADLESSITFWGKLGFNAVSKFTAPYPWAILSDGLGVVGLHQTTTFSYPAITYFASDMGEKIARLKKAGLKDLKEQGPSNAVLTTPELQHVFLYHLGGPGAAPEKKKNKALKTPTIETERLILRELGPEGNDELFTNYSDEEIMDFLGLNDAGELKTWKYKWEKGMTTYRTSYKRFLMVEKATGKTIGSCGYHNWYAEHQRAEVGYNMSNDAVKRKGYMTEALRAVLIHGFEKMELNRIEAFADPGNIPSVKLLTGFGFTKEGLLRSHYQHNGKMYDSVCFGLLKSEYKKLKKSWEKK